VLVEQISLVLGPGWVVTFQEQPGEVFDPLRDEALPIAEAVKPYFRDAQDHAFQILDIIESYRDMVTGLMDPHLSASSNRINEAMKTLTIVATIFIPLTFLAGVYGMNFDYMPELRWRWGYPAIWGVMLLLGAGFLLWVRRRHWFGTGADGMGG